MRFMDIYLCIISVSSVHAPYNPMNAAVRTSNANIITTHKDQNPIIYASSPLHRMIEYTSMNDPPMNTEKLQKYIRYCEIFPKKPMLSYA